MPRKNHLMLVILLALLLTLVIIVFAPFAVSNGVRFWIWWRARQEGFAVTVDGIDAPFLSPLVIHEIHLKSTRDNALRIEVTATDAKVALNLKHLLLHMRGRLIRNLSIEQFHVELRRSTPNAQALTRQGWATLQRLLPESLNIAKAEVRVENGPNLILLRGGSLSASASEPGRFSAAEIMIASPWLHQTFSQLRGATHWEANRLTLGGLTLSRGLDLQSAAADLSRLGKQRVGLQFDLASDISLAQTSDAFGFADRVDGLIHAANFTFRGNLAEPDRVTASLWSELTGPTWRTRTAEAIMLGAAVYNRKIQLQQLYIRQKTNQFTLSGEAAFPTTSSGWLSPDFRGNISASINQLGDFAALFGANPDDFAGKISVEGAMDTRDRKFGGRLAVEGASLTFFQMGVDSLTAELNLKATELEVEQLEITRKNDSLTGQGKIEMSHENNYSGTLDARADNLLDYFSRFRGSAGKKPNPIPIDLHATIDSSNWDAHGVIRVPDSSPISFTANFPLRIGTDWNAFQLSPVNITVDFPWILLGKAPQLFHPGIFQDGILSGNISLSETLQCPRIIGDMQLVNGKLSGDGWPSFNVTEASSRISFTGNHAAVEFLNVATKDADLLLHGEIDFETVNDVKIKMSGATPLFDLTAQQIDCVSKINITPATLTLAPAVAEFEFRGGVFQSDWTVTLQETNGLESLAMLDPDGGGRKFSLCLDTPSEEKTLLLGALPRAGDETRAKRQDKRR